MSIVINTNVASLNAQRNLGQSQNAMNVAMERLSSGLRINSARDDAAGLAITDRMNSQIRGLNQAAQNANDGISLAQTAEGALQESTNLLQNIRQLAVQSANDTNTTSDRGSIQDEVSQLISEIQRISENTTFNGQQLLDGTLQDATFHIGADAGQTISVSIDDASATALGENATMTSTTQSVGDSQNSDSLTSPSEVLEINGTAIATEGDGVSTTDDDASAKAVAAGINALSSETGVTATANANEANMGTISAGSLESGEFVLNGVTIAVSGIETGDNDGTLADAINAVSNQTGVTASMNESSELVLTAKDGRNIQLETDGTSTDAIFQNFDASGEAADIVAVGTVTLDSDEAFVVDTGLTAATHGMTIAAETYAVSTENAVSNIDVSTQSGANDAITNVDRAISQIDVIRGELGAVQNRFESTIANLGNVSENLSAARSRILDADIAQETSEMMKNNILQQAGVSILAQANQSPQLALSLLQ